MNAVPTSGMTALSIGKGISLNNAGELEATLRQIGATRYHSLHPFHRLLHGGKLNKGQVQAWALNRYLLPEHDPAEGRGGDLALPRSQHPDGMAAPHRGP